MTRRNLPGTKTEDFHAWEAQTFSDMDSSLATQQLIQQRIKADNSAIDDILELPASHDVGVWQYEQLRQCCLELNDLLVRLGEECTAESCPKMKATEEWSFLCAAHKQPQECSAQDFAAHTLDAATQALNNAKLFPSRLTVPAASLAHCQIHARRVYRIFAHAHFHHRALLQSFDNERSLFPRFVKLCKVYELMSDELFIVPTGDGDDDEEETDEEGS